MRNIRIADTTLKENSKPEDGFSFREKLEIAKLLDKLHISVIELPQLGDQQADVLLTKSIAAALQNSAVALPVGLTEEGVTRAWEAVKEAKHPRLQVCVPLSVAQMEYVCHKKPPVILTMIGMLCQKCRAYCDDVEFIAEDATRSEKLFLQTALTQAAENGATQVTVSDTAGIFMPDELQRFAAELMTLPALRDISFGVCCSDRLSVGTASSVAAVCAGASEIKTAALGGEMPTLESVSNILRDRGYDFDLHSDLDHTQLQRTMKQMRAITEARRKTSPFETGIAAADLSTLHLNLTANDSITAVSNAVKTLGYDLSEEDMAKVYAAFGRIAAKKDVNLRELEAIVASAALQVPPTYTLESYVINTGNVMASTAHMRLQKDGKLCQGICIGDGPIDAAFLAIEQITGHHYELDDFQIQSVTEGREAMGSAFIKLRSGGKLYSGKGISTDILGASIRAYINALNKIVYEENEI